MIYTVTNEFTKIAVTNGAIQNTSSCLAVEISETPTAGKGILLYPFQTFQLSGTTVYARTIGKESVDLRAVSFHTGTGSGSSSGGSGVTVDESLVAGSNGLVPAPSAGDNSKFLRGDGTWAMFTIGSTPSTVEGAFWLEDD